MLRSLALAALWGVSGCVVYTEDLLTGSEGGGGAGGESAGGAGGGGSAGTHLLISEIVVTPTEGELVEVFNPGDAAVPLDDVWLADFASYHEVAGGSATVPMTDFLVQFAAGSMIGAGERIVVSIASEDLYTAEYSTAPDYSLTTMTGTTYAMSGLANTNEVLVLFEWDGQATTVRDLDILTWGDSSDAVDKTGISGYQPETPADDQGVAEAPITGGQGLHRCDFDESSETKEGGNGVTGHDETSENVAAAFAPGTRSPKASPPDGVCP